MLHICHLIADGAGARHPGLCRVRQPHAEASDHLLVRCHLLPAFAWPPLGPFVILFSTCGPLTSKLLLSYCACIAHPAVTDLLINRSRRMTAQSPGLLQCTSLRCNPQAGAGGVAWGVGSGRLPVPALCLGQRAAGRPPFHPPRVHPEQGGPGHLLAGLLVPVLRALRQAGAHPLPARQPRPCCPHSSCPHLSDL